MTQSGSDLRRLSPEELEKLGQESLREHLLAQAMVAHRKYRPLTFEKLDALLHDPACLRSVHASTDGTSQKGPVVWCPRRRDGSRWTGDGSGAPTHLDKSVDGLDPPGGGMADLCKRGLPYRRAIYLPGDSPAIRGGAV